MIGKKEATHQEIRAAEQAQLSKKAHKKRQTNQERYDQFNIEPTTVEMENGSVITKSRLEALWLEELKDCDSFKCVECIQVPLWIDGPFGKFLSNYKPDIIIELKDRQKIYLELKPTIELALADDRQQRALKLNPRMKMVVIGGYPYTKKGVLVRLLTGNEEIIHRDVSVCSVLEFLGCECNGRG